MSYRSPFLVIAAVVAGCYTGSAVDTNAGPWVVTGTTTDTNGTDPSPAASAGKPGSNIHGPTHLPCDVEKVLSDNCWNCHGTVPGNDASNSLVTYDDLAAANATIPGMREIDVSLIRMSSVKAPMPPTGKPDDAVTAVLQKWVDDGMPKGNCGEEVVCTSGKTIPTSSNMQTALTDPGTACLGCHSKKASALTVGGTVYATAHEPDGCAGESKVILIDAKGEAHTLPTNASGNFSTTDAIPSPYRAMVVRGTEMSEMQTPQSNGDCNSCHSLNAPAFDAGLVPGRIMLPRATTKE